MNDYHFFSPATVAFSFFAGMGIQLFIIGNKGILEVLLGLIMFAFFIISIFSDIEEVKE
jgi:hypothetical protein